MRGKVAGRPGLHRRRGITPAHAGKSWPPLVQPLPARDHPRACGEKYSCFFNAPRCTGSPPRMRGKDRHSRGRQFPTGITPAHAGKSKSLFDEIRIDEDHPRACGEKSESFIHEISHLGSPPRMRGKESSITCAARSVRITPAHAGKRQSRCRHRSARWDHPRACGEKRWPPRARHTRQDHPRACGEKRTLVGFSVASLGSPPRMRGKALAVFLTIGLVRITPAHAGKST